MSDVRPGKDATVGIRPLEGPFRTIADALADDAQGAWFVGGSIRDALLGIEVVDVDLAIAGDAKQAARRIHNALGGDIFSLSDRFGTWRVLSLNGLQIDITALRGDSIEDDVAMRDFTVNAMAVPADERDAAIDRFGGIADLDARLLRVLGESAYVDDPLRPLRMARFAAQLQFAPDKETIALTRKHAAAVTQASAERIFTELKLLIGGDHAVDGVRRLESLGLLDAIIPELGELRGVEQSVYHHLDAWEHTLEVLEHTVKIVADPEPVFLEHAAMLSRELDVPLGDQLSRADALRWGALLHDVAKGRTRVVSDEGRVGFPGHDRLGAEMCREILGRLNASEKLTRYVAALTRHHLRLGFLVHKQPLDDREVFKYLKQCSPVEVEVGVLSVADRLATRGRKAEVAISAHTDVAVLIAERAIDWRADPPKSPVRGDQLAEALGIERGPIIGELLARIEEGRYLGELETPDEAIEFARRALKELESS